MAAVAAFFCQPPPGAPSPSPGAWLRLGIGLAVYYEALPEEQEVAWKATGQPQGNLMPYIGPNLIPVLAKNQYLLILIAFLYVLVTPTHVYESQSAAGVFLFF